jgi:hypothetical protein
MTVGIEGSSKAKFNVDYAYREGSASRSRKILYFFSWNNTERALIWLI